MTSAHHILLQDVSRETASALSLHVDLLRKWNASINLVSHATVDDVWTRHVADSVQVFALYNGVGGHWVDIGTGGGFPGLVVAILGAQAQPSIKFTLVESDQRKATFLRQVIRQTGIKASVIDSRVEEIPRLNATVVSARALADLSVLLGYAHLHMTETGTALFQKGRTWQDEVNVARENWSFDLTKHTSTTDPNAVILQIGNLSHV